MEPRPGSTSAPFGLQPAELAKPLLIAVLAAHCARARGRFGRAAADRRPPTRRPAGGAHPPPARPRNRHRARGRHRRCRRDRRSFRFRHLAVLAVARRARRSSAASGRGPRAVPDGAPDRLPPPVLRPPGRHLEPPAGQDRHRLGGRSRGTASSPAARPASTTSPSPHRLRVHRGGGGTGPGRSGPCSASSASWPGGSGGRRRGPRYLRRPVLRRSPGHARLPGVRERGDDHGAHTHHRDPAATASATEVPPPWVVWPPSVWWPTSPGDEPGAPGPGLVRGARLSST